MRQAGADVVVFHYKGAWSPINYARAVLNFRKAYHAAQPDIVYGRFGQCGLVAMAQHGSPLIMRFGGSDLIGWRTAQGKEPVASYVLRLSSWLAARRADAVIIPDTKMAQHLPRSDYHLIPAGIDLALFHPLPMDAARGQLGLPTDRKLVLFAADPNRIIKRVSLAQQAVEMLKQECAVELVIASGVPHAQIPTYMNACDALVLTSQHEGSPNVVKEAMACNLPVVSTDVGDVRQRIGALDSCYVSSEDTPQAIALGLRHVLQQTTRPDLRSQVTGLDAVSVAQQTLRVFQQTIDNR